MNNYLLFSSFLKISFHFFPFLSCIFKILKIRKQNIKSNTFQLDDQSIFRYAYVSITKYSSLRFTSDPYAPFTVRGEVCARNVVERRRG